jgi:hypothetical protein
MAVILVVAALAAAGCRPTPAADAAPPAAALHCTPDRVSLPAGSSIQLQAQANDAAGRPVGGAPLHFRVEGADLVRVSPAGLLVAAGRPGATTVVVESAGVRAEVPVEVVPGAPTLLEVSSGQDQAAQVGAALPALVAVRALDGFGNPVPGAPLTFGATEGGGTAAPAEAVAGLDGLARTRWTLGPTSGRQRLRAQAAGGAGVQVAIDATALVGPAARLELRSVEVPAAPAGTTLDVSVAVLDAHGNAVPRAPVAFRVISGGGSASPPAAFTAADGGAASRWTLGARTARNELRATSALLPGRLVAAATSGTPGPPSRVARRPEPATAGRLGAPIRPLPGVLVQDAVGNPVAGVPVRFSLASGAGLVEPAVVATDDQGVARPLRWIACSAGAVAVAAEVEGLPPAVLPATIGPAGGGPPAAACQGLAADR